MYKIKLKQENIKEAGSWESFEISPNLIKTIHSYGYFVVFNFFRENWKKVLSAKKNIIPYNIDECEEKNLFFSIYCLQMITPKLYQIQFLFVFSNDFHAAEFYELFSFLSKSMKIKTLLILDQNKIVDDKNKLISENPEIVIGSINKLSYEIKKHYLNVFTIKNVIIDLFIDELNEFKEEIYEEFILMLPETSKKTFFYLQNEHCKKKYIKTLDSFL